MSKIIQAFLSGVFFTFLLDFFLFLGIFQNYIKKNEIDVYYNILFADHQSSILYFLMSMLLGFFVVYKGIKPSLLLIGSLSTLVLLTLIEPIGQSVGEMMLMQKNVTIKMKKFSYRGDVLYDGRQTVTFYDYNLQKVLHLEKNKIIGEYK